jgi:hypothetical protein
MQKSEIERKAREGGILTISEAMYWLYGMECYFKKGPRSAEGNPGMVYLPGSVFVTDKEICVITTYGEPEDTIRMPRHMTHKAILDVRKEAKGHQSGTRIVLSVTGPVRPNAYHPFLSSRPITVEECWHIASAEPMRKLYKETIPMLNDGTHELFKRPFPWELTCPEALSVYRALDVEPPPLQAAAVHF